MVFVYFSSFNIANKTTNIGVNSTKYILIDLLHINKNDNPNANNPFIIFQLRQNP